MITRTDIINKFINKRNYKTYLEIGVLDCVNFNNIIVDEKIGIDPEPKVLNENIIKITSDNFFKELSDDIKFDIIFIDGDHTYEQVIKDIQNSLKHLSVNGIIIMHDVITQHEYETCTLMEIMYKMFGVNYNGTTYQAFIQMVMLNEFTQKYNIYYTGHDFVGVIDTQFDINIHKDNNMLEKYINIIKQQIKTVNSSCEYDYNNIDTQKLLVSSYRIGFKDYVKNKSWLYPIGKLNLETI